MEHITNPDASDRAIQEMVQATINDDKTIAGIIVLRLHKDGSVRPYLVDRMEQPKEYFPTITASMVSLLQRSFRRIQEAGELCNCPKCIARRGGVYNGNQQAQA